MVGVTFEDVAVYFSRTEWQLLDEAQRCLYLHVMLENFALISSLGCCCGTRDLEASIEQNVSVRMSQAKKTQLSVSSQNSHPCESCGLVLRDIFQLVEQQGIQHSPKLLMCGACAKPFYFSTKCYQHQEQHRRDKCFIRGVDRASLVKSGTFSVSQKLLTSQKVGHSILIASGQLQQQAPYTPVKPSEISKAGVICQNRKNYNAKEECKKVIGCSDTLVPDHAGHTGRQCLVGPESKKCFRGISGFHCQNVHSLEKPYECNECGKSYRRKDNLNEHQRIHSGEKPYECGECGMSFSQKWSLNQHQRSHSGEKPYECSDCGKSFTYCSGLRGHQSVHTGEKPYDCSECGKCFTTKSYLHVHQRIHSGEKRYKCRECGKSFTYCSGLRGHTEKSRMSVVNVGNVLPQNPTFMFIREFTQVKDVMSAVNVGNLLCVTQNSVIIREFTLEKSRMSAVNVGNLLSITLASVVIREFTLEKSHMSAMIVENLLSLALNFVVIGKFIEQRPYECSHCGKSSTCCTGLRCQFRVHTGERPYECCEYGESFMMLSPLHKHQISYRRKAF